jgi:tetratricopeptide (TPR) repeat protein
LKFARTNKKSDANIIVEVVPSPRDLCRGSECKYVAGVTVPIIKSRRLTLMTIMVYDKDPVGNYLSEKDFYNIVLHEAGHALGIMGHSYKSDDLMYMASSNGSVFSAFRSDFQNFSQRDINTIRLLYKLVPDISNNAGASGSVYPPIVLGTSAEMSESKIREALHYIEQAPNLASGYTDLGSAYAQGRQYEKAFEAFGKAYGLAANDSERYIIFYNMSVTYLNTGDSVRALKYARNAQALDDNDEIRDLIKSIKH